MLFKMDDYSIAAAAYFFMCYYNNLRKKKKKPRKRRWWMVSLHHSRKRYDGINMLADLQQEHSGQFENFCRMSSSDFNNLLDRIGPSIARRDTKWRKAIPAKIRLAVTLRFLATGDSYQSLHYLFKISPQVISEIVPEVCSAIIEALKDNIKIPKEKQEWLAIASNFETRWQFPHCLGVTDGKHIVLQCPFNTNSEYYNYKGSFSIVLMALVDSNYNFIYADVGCQPYIF
ncbi:uncharacterized protein LOC126744758 [Anthonomus grandis grandis]|uniref:uncharacterized protein LOC126744758 n=1 Tax=Anthonomus grandis grandis TaxID=2921223 RepID=UPI002165D42C|nr:uncharacterized protein LOC126744758 [Anthonomus grandis grandis]